MVFVKAHFFGQKQITFFIQNILFSTQTHAGGLCGCSVVRFFQKPSFYLSARLVFLKDCSAPGRRPLKNLQFFNISLFRSTKNNFSKIEFAPLSGNTRPGPPRGLTFIHQSSLLLKEFDVFFWNPSFYFSNLILFHHGTPLGLPWPSGPSPGPPLGPLWVVMLSPDGLRICMKSWSSILPGCSVLM